jgi:hypothetical protein
MVPLTIYQVAKEYVTVAKLAHHNSFDNDKIAKAVKCYDEVVKRADNPSSYPQDKYYKAAKDIYDLVCLCDTQTERVIKYLSHFGIEGHKPYEVLYSRKTEFTRNVVDVDLVYEDDTTEHIMFSREGCKNRAQLIESLKRTYEGSNTLITCVSDMYTQRITTYTYDRLYSKIDNIYNKEES